MALALALLLMLGLVLGDEVKQRVLVEVPDRDDDTDLEAAVDALEDLEVLLVYEGEAVKDGEDDGDLEFLTLKENEAVMQTVGVDVTLKLTVGLGVPNMDPDTLEVAPSEALGPGESVVKELRLRDWELEGVSVGETLEEALGLGLVAGVEVRHRVGEGDTVALAKPEPDPPTPTQGEVLPLRDGLRDTEGEEV